MRDDRFEVSLSFDERRGYVAKSACRNHARIEQAADRYSDAVAALSRRNPNASNPTLHQAQGPTAI